HLLRNGRSGHPTRPAVYRRTRGGAASRPTPPVTRCARRASWPPGYPARPGRGGGCATGAPGPRASGSRGGRARGVGAARPGPRCWLVIRRSLGTEPEFRYYVSNAGAETPLSTLALVACTRCRVEEFFEDCKSYLGMTQYETRSWVGWHHHMTLVGLAHLFVTLVQRRLQKKTPELTLDRTVRLLETALEEPELRLPRSTALVVYHGRRNEVTRTSHAKTWRAKHRGVKFLRL